MGKRLNIVVLGLHLSFLIPGCNVGFRTAELGEMVTGDKSLVRVLYNSDMNLMKRGAEKQFTAHYGGSQPSQFMPEDIDDHADHFKGTAITDFFINVNGQRTNYDSDVWESEWDGYDPNLGDDQPFFSDIDPNRGFERDTIRELYAFAQMGVDYPARLIQRLRKNGIRPWISIRMNDSHYAPQEHHEHPYHSTVWKNHKQWWVAPYRFNHWSDRGLDYAQPEVRSHYMALIKEVLDRYDMDGLELDFLRFLTYFRPGHEEEGRQIMNQFITQIAKEVQSAERRRGHDIEMAVRVAARPNVARGRGHDAIVWARTGLIDMVIAGSDWQSSDNDIPIEHWKELLAGTGVLVAAGFEDGIRPDGYQRVGTTMEQARCLVLGAIHRGADAVYLFNHVGYNLLNDWTLGKCERFLADVGSHEALAASSRDHVLTMQCPSAEGEARPKSLPFSGKWGGVSPLQRPSTGPRPEHEGRDGNCRRHA